MTTTEKILTGFVAGTVVGSLVGVLFAPDKGSRTRAQLASKSRELQKAADKSYHQAKEWLGLEKNNGEDLKKEEKTEKDRMTATS